MNQAAQLNMVKQQLRTGNVLAEPVLHLFEHLPRDAFVPHPYKPFAYSDMQIPLPHGQCMMTPTEEGLLLQALALQGHETILEVGTGSGYLTALLSRLCKKVITFDVIDDFIKQAPLTLAKHHCHNVEYHHGNAFHGFPKDAPYDCIVMSGGITALQDKLLLQLSPGGRLVTLIGSKTVQEAMIYTANTNQTTTAKFLFSTTLPLLIPAQAESYFTF